MFEFLAGIPIIGDIFSGAVDAIGSIFDTPGLPGALGSAAQAAAGYAGAGGANAMNLQISREAQDFNAQQAAINRQFQAEQAQHQMNVQEDWSNTSYQRAVGDLQKAGLNPMLAYQHGGASTPSGASGSGSAASSPAMIPMQNKITSAFQGMQLGQELENMRSMQRKTEAETALTYAQIPKVAQDISTSISSANLMSQQRLKISEEITSMYVERRKLETEMDRIRSETARNEFYVKEIMPLELLLTKMEAQLRDLEIPGAINKASAEGTAYAREWSPVLRRPLEDVGRGLSIGKDAAVGAAAARYGFRGRRP